MLKRFGLFSCLCITTSFVSAGDIRVYAASSLSHAVNDIVKLYQQQHPSTKLITTFVDPVLLSRQISQGDNADIYLSTDKAGLQALSQKKIINQNRAKYLISNQLVAITSVNLDIPFGPVRQFNFAQAFKGKLCTSQLESTALGQYTQQGLNNLGWMTGLQQRITQYTDSSAILNAVQNGRCDVGITYQTDALTTKKVKMMGVFPAKVHEPIDYYIQLTAQGEKNKGATQFERFILTNSKVKNLLFNYGFTTKK